MIEGGEVLLDVVTINAGDIVRFASNRATKLVYAKERFLEDIFDMPHWGRFVHAYFFDDDALFAFDLFRVEEWVKNHIVQDIKEEHEMLAWGLDVKRGVVLGGESVELRADTVEVLRQFEGGRSRLRAFEEEMLDEMSDAIDARVFVTGADLD